MKLKTLNPMRHFVKAPLAVMAAPVLLALLAVVPNLHAQTVLTGQTVPALINQDRRLLATMLNLILPVNPIIFPVVI